MKQIYVIKKIIIIVALILFVNLILSSSSYAVGNVFSDAEGFLSKRRSNIKYNK